jgi:hypothetical protein
MILRLVSSAGSRNLFGIVGRLLLTEIAHPPIGKSLSNRARKIFE